LRSRATDIGPLLTTSQHHKSHKKFLRAFSDLLFFLKMTDVAHTREDGEMEEMMSKWETENGVDESDDDDDAEVLDEDELTKFHRTLVIPDESFDHVVLGTSDVERSIEDFEKLTGVRPVYVISLNGLGTKSARGKYPSTLPIVLSCSRITA
jgi:hypothetical protein